MVEDVNLWAMGGCLSLGKACMIMGLDYSGRCLHINSEKKGSCLARIDRMYPSSKTCSVCGAVNQGLKLSDRIYICPECGCAIDLDYNAAVNIREEAAKERRQKKKKAERPEASTSNV